LHDDFISYCTLGRGGAAVIVPGRRFGECLAVMCGLIRRYGASEPTIAHALLQLLSSCAAVAADDPERCAATRSGTALALTCSESLQVRSAQDC
jgi:uncharacterized membrane protein